MGLLKFTGLPSASIEFNPSVGLALTTANLNSANPRDSNDGHPFFVR